jgi:hypothetical protein
MVVADLDVIRVASSPCLQAPEIGSLVAKSKHDAAGVEQLGNVGRPSPA